MRKLSILGLGLLLTGLHAQAAPIDLALGKPVTYTDYYNQGSETFPGSNVTNGQLNDSGTGYNWSFWLTSNGSLGSVTVDLQTLYSVSEIDLQNTHNRGFNDRGTNAFQISLSSDGVNFSSPVISSALSPVWGDNPIPIEQFPITATNARYVKFDMLSFYGGSGGLNEIMVYGGDAVVPEPTSVSLALIAGMIPLSYRRSRKAC